MELHFKMIDNKHIMIVDEKDIPRGEIFTPAGSGEAWTNAIQVCGIDEVFDYWGCANFQKPSYDEKRMCNKVDERGNTIWEHAKDIELRFSKEIMPCNETQRSTAWKHCHKCFNDPCTCENHGRHENPYQITRSNNLYLEHKGNKQ